MFPSWATNERVPDDVLEQQLAVNAAYRAVRQLQAWRERGYCPQLHGTSEGWVLALDTTKWGQMEIGERARSEALRFCTAPCETPEAAVEAALKVIQP